jgi:hypothetical protein
MMLIGMGLMKLGVLGAEGSRRLYGLFALIGYGSGIPLNSYTPWLMIQHNFDPVIHQSAHPPTISAGSPSRSATSRRSC